MTFTRTKDKLYRGVLSQGQGSLFRGGDGVTILFGAIRGSWFRGEEGVTVLFGAMRESWFRGEEGVTVQSL